MTYDNGIEMARHEKITQKNLHEDLFYTSLFFWKNGTKENTNGLIIRYLPKGTNFKEISENQFQIIQKN